MPKYICPLCHTEHSYCKDDKPPVCKCNVPFFQAEPIVPVIEEKKPDTIGIQDIASAEIEHPKQGEVKTFTKTKRHFKGGGSNVVK